MRVIYDIAGNDITTTVQSLLQNGRTFYMANLYTFAQRQFWKNDPTGFMAFWTFTDADFPVQLTNLQLFASGTVQLSTLNGNNVLYNASGGVPNVTYAPENFQRSKLSYQVGLEAKDIDVTWFIDDTVDYFAPLSGSYGTLLSPNTSFLSMKQAMATYRAFDDCPFWIHRVVFSPYDPILPGSLLGAFTDGTGQLVIPPFLIGRGISITVPPGATQLQMGMSDYPYSDNTGSWIMNVNGSNVTVSGTATPYVCTGGLNSAYTIPASGASAPATVTGLTPGHNVTISYVSGLCGFHFSSPPFFDPYGVVNYSNPALVLSSQPGQYATSNKISGGIVTYGTTLMYRGYIRQTEASANYLKISLGSLMQILQDVQVPSQLIMPGNRDVQFLPSPWISTVYLKTPFSVTSPVTINFTANVTITANQLQDCWLTFQPTLPANVWAPQNGLPPASIPGWRIMSNTAAAALGTTTVTFYDPPIVPASPAAFNIFGQATGSAPGFAHVPPPENSL